MGKGCFASLGSARTMYTDIFFGCYKKMSLSRLCCSLFVIAIPWLELSKYAQASFDISKNVKNVHGPCLFERQRKDGTIVIVLKIFGGFDFSDDVGKIARLSSLRVEKVSQ